MRYHYVDGAGRIRSVPYWLWVTGQVVIVLAWTSAFVYATSLIAGGKI